MSELDLIKSGESFDHEINDEQLGRVLGGLTSSQVGQRGDAVPGTMFGQDRIGAPQAYLFWTNGGWHGG